MDQQVVPLIQIDDREVVVMASHRVSIIWTVRFTSQPDRHRDGTLDQLALYPVDLIQVGDSL